MRIGKFAALLAVVLIVLAGVPHFVKFEKAPHLSSVAKILEGLDSKSEFGREAVPRRLASLPDEGLETMCRLLWGEVDLSSVRERPLSAREAEALYAGIALRRGADLERVLRGRMAEDDSERCLRECMMILGKVATRDDWPFVQEIIESFNPNLLIAGPVAMSVRRSLEEMMIRDRYLARVSFRGWSEMHRAVQELLVRCAVTAGEPADLEPMLGIVGRDPERGVYILRELGRFSFLSAGKLGWSERDKFRDLLDHDDPKFRAEGIGVIMRFRDEESMDAVIARLEDSDRRVVRAAHRGLQKLSRLRYPAEAETWRGWWEIEATWIEEHHQELAERLCSDEVPVVLGALREAALHPLVLDRLNELLPPIAVAESPVLRATLAEILGHCGHVRRAHLLVDLCADADPKVAEAAKQALRAL